jgi:hypothetical protein
MPWLEEGPPAIHCVFKLFIIISPSTKQYAFEYTKGFKNHGINLCFFFTGRTLNELGKTQYFYGPISTWYKTKNNSFIDLYTKTILWS